MHRIVIQVSLGRLPLTLKGVDSCSTLVHQDRSRNAIVYYGHPSRFPRAYGGFQGYRYLSLGPAVKGLSKMLVPLCQHYITSSVE